MEFPKVEAHPITEEIWMVPCIIKREENYFQPLCTPYSETIEWKKSNLRHIWDPKEDEALVKITSVRGTKAWIHIAKELNEYFHSSLPIRSAKQCRERYINHLDPSLNKQPWSSEEDLHILQKQNEIGNRWSRIAKDLHGRTENQIKNRFRSLLKAGVNFDNNSKT